MKIILVMGLPGAGKTTLANELALNIKDRQIKRLNADEVRSKANDWDFSRAGRMRQSMRMSEQALKYKKENFLVIADFVCPTPETRSQFPADYIIWVDTIKQGRFEDTNQMFVEPEKYDFQVTTKNAKKWSLKILEKLKEIL